MNINVYTNPPVDFICTCLYQMFRLNTVHVPFTFLQVFKAVKCSIMYVFKLYVQL